MIATNSLIKMTKMTNMRTTTRPNVEDEDEDDDDTADEDNECWAARATNAKITMARTNTTNTTKPVQQRPTIN